MSETKPETSLPEVFEELSEEALNGDPMMTIRTRPSGEPGVRLSAVEDLHKQADHSNERIRRMRELGRGGMGVVHLAEQRSLGRTVAVKELLQDAAGTHGDRALLLEAWILGKLEHPNVVPVHDLMLDEQGHPLVVLKRIEGESWLSLLADDHRVREQYGAEDVLDWHLSVLIQVCNAVSFAHSRGILHRDLKPENVMVGRFGEIYLVDWGVAVALHDDGTGRFPLANEVRSFAGTPTYMAPEMLGGRDARISEKTDVYLLGATLFHVVTGRPPHRGDTLLEIATNLAIQEPPLPAGTPEGLAAICRRAMQGKPEDRYESADAFRTALQDYLRHRPAELFIRQGQETLDELADLASAPAEDREAHRAQMFKLFSEARLGFRLARRSWPSNEAARRGLREASETMIDYLLLEGDAASAATLASQMEGEVPAAIQQRLDAAKDANKTQRRRQARLEALEKDFDPAIGRRARFFAYGALALQLLVVQVVGHSYRPLETHEGLIGSTAGLVAVLLLLGFAARRYLLPTRLNRQFYGLVVIAFVGKLAAHVVFALLDRAPSDGHILSGVLYAIVAAAAAVAYHRGLGVVAAAFACAAVAAAALPEFRFLFYAAASCVMLVTLAGLYLREAGADPP